MEDYGIKISLPGFNVYDATPEQCSIHTKYDTLKVNDHASPAHYGVVQATVGTEPANGSTKTIKTFAHGYTHRPSVWAHVLDPARTAAPYGVTGFYALDAFAESYIKISVTDTDFNIVLRKGTTAPPTLLGRVFTIRYYIFAEDGN